jgi:hypothetical protein
MRPTTTHRDFVAGLRTHHAAVLIELEDQEEQPEDHPDVGAHPYPAIETARIHSA